MCFNDSECVFFDSECVFFRVRKALNYAGFRTPKRYKRYKRYIYIHTYILIASKFFFIKNLTFNAQSPSHPNPYLLHQMAVLGLSLWQSHVVAA